MEASEIIQTIETLHRDARARRLFFQQVKDERLRGRGIVLNGRHVTSFGSCSYLGLEFHPALIEGVCDAVRRFGTQFSSSRGYVSAPAYEELEALLGQMFDAHALVVPTTTLGHQAAFDVLLSEKDALVMDHQVHASVQQAANLARAKGTHVAIVRHEELEKAEALLAELARRHRTVWFTTDGITSMYGDLAPFALLQRLLDVAPNVRLYIDDAHGMSWRGAQGRGSFLARFPLSERVVLATSLNKAFAAGGGVLVFASAEERDRVRLCGGNLIFSGPLQPPMLGAAVASAKVHLSDEITGLQRELRDRVLLTNRLLRDAGLPLLVENDVPIRFIRMGLPKVASAVAERMLADGFYVNVSMYPTVPMRRAGIRLSINAIHELDHIHGMVASLARHVPAVLAQEGLSHKDLDELFARSVVSQLGRAPAPESPKAPAPKEAAPYDSGKHRIADSLRVDHARSISELDAAEWDGLLGSAATCSASSMATVEALFTGQPRREHNWTFDYVVIRDRAGRPVCATHFTTALQKDDFLMRDHVSREVEKRRAEDPYFLTSRAVMMGSSLSEGNHLFLDRAGPWRPALSTLLTVAHEIYEREAADLILLRDLPGDDPEMDAFLLEQGFVSMPMPNSHVVALDPRGEDAFVEGLSRKRRQHVHRQQKRAELFEVRSHGAGSRARAPLSPGEIAHLDALYRSVAGRKFRINVFALPENLTASLLASPAWEIVTLRLRPEAGGPADRQPVAWWAAHVHDGHYAVFLCGLDYRYVLDFEVYRQMLYQTVHQAYLRGATTLHLGMDADIEKTKFGTSARATKAYVQAREHFNAAVLRELVAEIGMTGTG